MGMARSRENWHLKNKKYALLCLERFTPFSLDQALLTHVLIRGAEWAWSTCFDHLTQAWPITVLFYQKVPVIKVTQ